MKCFKRTVKANSDNRGTNISYAFGVPERNNAMQKLSGYFGLCLEEECYCLLL